MEVREEAREILGLAWLEIVFPPCPRGQRQLSPKHYLESARLKEPPATPNVGGSHSAMGRQRLCLVSLEKGPQADLSQEAVKSAVYLEFPGFRTPYDLRWPWPAAP